MHIPLLVRTDRFVVVAKPAPLLVHRVRGVPDTQFALQLVRDQVGREVHPIHRLDRQTSGCLVFALDRAEVAPLTAALAAGTKSYVALVRGWYRGREPVLVDNPMKDDRGRVKQARTWVEPVAGGPDPRCSLLLARPETGRYHQVRRHVRDLNHPVLGDSMHGDTRVNRWWREERGLPRLGLHCLSLDLALEDGPLQVSCPLPEGLSAVLRVLPWWDQAVEALPGLALPWPSAPLPARSDDSPARR